MLSRKAFWSLTLVIAVAGLAGGALVGDNLLHQKVSSSHAAWAEIYSAPGEMARRVESIVVAKAVGVEPGRVAYSDNGEDALPFEVYQFEVEKAIKGHGESTVFVERAGGVTPEGESVFLDPDGGPFEIGQTYLLFLKQQTDGPYYYQVNAQGRFRVANGRLSSLEKNDVVVDRLNGHTLDEGLRVVRQGLRPVVR